MEIFSSGFWKNRATSSAGPYSSFNVFLFVKILLNCKFWEAFISFTWEVVMQMVWNKQGIKIPQH